MKSFIAILLITLLASTNTKMTMLRNNDLDFSAACLFDAPKVFGAVTALAKDAMSKNIIGLVKDLPNAISVMRQTYNDCIGNGVELFSALPKNVEFSPACLTDAPQVFSAIMALAKDAKAKDIAGLVRDLPTALSAMEKAYKDCIGNGLQAKNVEFSPACLTDAPKVFSAIMALAKDAEHADISALMKDLPAALGTLQTAYKDCIGSGLQMQAYKAAALKQKQLRDGNECFNTITQFGGILGASLDHIEGFNLPEFFSQDVGKITWAIGHIKQVCVIDELDKMGLPGACVADVTEIVAKTAKLAVDVDTADIPMIIMDIPSIISTATGVGSHCF